MSAAILLAAGIASFAGVQPQLAAGGGAVYVTFAAGDAISVARSTDAGATFTTPVVLAGRRQARPRPPSRAARRRHAGRRGRRGDRRGQGRRRRRRRRPLPLSRSRPHLVAVDRDQRRARRRARGPARARRQRRRPGGRRLARPARQGDAGLRRDVARSRRDMVAGRARLRVAVGIDLRVLPSVGGGRRRRRRRDACSATTSTAGATCTWSESRDGATFGPAVKQGTGSWPLDACPMDGGAIATAGGTVHTVWRRETTIYAAATAAGAAASGPETALGDGRDAVRRHRGRTHRRGVDRRRRCPAPPGMDARRWPSGLAVSPACWPFPIAPSRRSSTRAASPSTSCER